MNPMQLVRLSFLRNFPYSIFPLKKRLLCTRLMDECVGCGNQMCTTYLTVDCKSIGI